MTVFVADLVHDITMSIMSAYRHVYWPRNLKTLNENQRQKCHLCALTRGAFMACLSPWSRYQTFALAIRNGISTSGENFPFNIVSKYLRGVSRQTHAHFLRHALTGRHVWSPPGHAKISALRSQEADAINKPSFHSLCTIRINKENLHSHFPLT